MERLLDARGANLVYARTTCSPPNTKQLRRRECRSSNANSLCGQNSAGSRKSVRPFKEIIWGDVSEFESHMPSHAVRSLRRDALAFMTI
jgi:hypothetical protein